MQFPDESKDAFEKWWMKTGRLIDPDTSEIPWVDKCKGLAAVAFEAAMAISRNYIADDDVHANVVVFSNGRRVQVYEEDGKHHLTVAIAN
jgi:hypothetical protein